MTSHVGPGHGGAAGQVGVGDEISHRLRVEPDAVATGVTADTLTHRRQPFGSQLVASSSPSGEDVSKQLLMFKPLVQDHSG